MDEVILCRIIGLILLVLSFIVKTSDFVLITKPNVQLILGLSVVAIILFFDAIFGLILGLSILIMFMRVNTYILGIDINYKFKSNSKKTPYVTAKNLEDAQTNVYSNSKDIIGVVDPITNSAKDVWGAQGSLNEQKLEPYNSQDTQKGYLNFIQTE